jgi:hypothetical protein
MKRPIKRIFIFFITSWLIGIGVSCKKNEIPDSDTGKTCYPATQKTPSVTRTLAYGSSRHLSKLTETDSSGNQTGYYTFDYSSSNNKVSRITRYLFPFTSYDSYDVIEYNSGGQEIRAHHFEQDGLKYTETRYSAYEYNASGQRTKTSLFVPDGLDFSLDSYDRYEYDADGNIIRLSTFDKSDSSTGFIRYTYDDKINPFKILSLPYESPLDQGVSNVKSMAVYESSGQLDYTESYSFDYNAKGLPVSSTFKSADGTQYMTTYTYDCE